MRKKEERYFAIGVVAKMYNIHQQTLRLYEREGLLKPARSHGNTRLYSEKDLERLELILNLSRDMGVNLAGVDIILNLREKIQEMQQQINELVRYLKTELEKNAQQASPTGGPGLVKSPSASLVRLSQITNEVLSGIKR
jgi:MerR family transcriptional regulator, heat shock protein HspR